jgi:hypothetical protein
MSGERIRVLSYPNYEELYIDGKIVAEGSRIEMKDFLDLITTYFGITTKLLTINLE